MKNIHVESMTEEQAKTLIDDLMSFFGIGAKASVSSLRGNIENCKRFADQLHAIEREFFMVAGEPDEDYPDDEPEDVCLVNCWGSSKEKYVEQFREALNTIANT